MALSSLPSTQRLCWLTLLNGCWLCLQALKDWLRWLQHDIGFAGWRLDFVKG
jgi:hypothetical protein